MKRYLWMMAAALVFTGYSAIAQDTRPDADEEETDVEKMDKENEKGKLNEYDEIIIKRKGDDKDSKVTVEIRDGEVFVDGKPIDEYKNDELSVRKRSMNRYHLRGPGSAFRFEGDDWLKENDFMMGNDVAFLGVSTEGSSKGAKVTEVTKNSAAEKAGLKSGDVITAVGDKKTFDHEQLSAAIKDKKPGDKVEIVYERDGKKSKATATLGSRKAPVMSFRNFEGVPPMAFEYNGPGNMPPMFEMRSKGRLGIKAQDTEDGNGVKVLEVEDGSAAEKAGIKADDIITSFEGKKVNSATELAQAAREAREKATLKVDLKRNGKPQTIEVKVPKKLKTANL